MKNHPITRIIPLTLLLLLISITGFAQGTQVNSSPIYYDGSGVNIGGLGNISLRVRHLNGKDHISASIGDLFLNYNTGKNVFVGVSSNQSNLLVRGNVGIGTDSPTSKLHVNGNAKIGGNLTSSVLRLEATDEAGAPVRAVGLELHGYESRGKGIYITDKNTPDKWFIGEGYNYDGIGIGYSTTNSTEYSVNTKFIVKGSGNVGIGTTTPGEKLEVNGNAIFNGNIESKKVKVTQSPGNWPDYVFAKNYELRTLNEIEDFIKTNQHLPDVPSAKEVEVNGLDLGNMDATLLKKVEELTLYVIQQNKRLEKLENENSTLKKEVKQLKINK